MGFQRRIIAKIGKSWRRTGSMLVLALSLIFAGCSVIKMPNTNSGIITMDKVEAVVVFGIIKSHESGDVLGKTVFLQDGEWLYLNHEPVSQAKLSFNRKGVFLADSKYDYFWLDNRFVKTFSPKPEVTDFLVTLWDGRTRLGAYREAANNLDNEKDEGTGNSKNKLTKSQVSSKQKIVLSRQDNPKSEELELPLAKAAVCARRVYGLGIRGPETRLVKLVDQFRLGANELKVFPDAQPAQNQASSYPCLGNTIIYFGGTGTDIAGAQGSSLTPKLIRWDTLWQRIERHKLTFTPGVAPPNTAADWEGVEFVPSSVSGRMLYWKAGNGILYATAVHSGLTTEYNTDFRGQKTKLINCEVGRICLASFTGIDRGKITIIRITDGKVLKTVDISEPIRKLGPSYQVMSVGVPR